MSDTALPVGEDGTAPDADGITAEVPEPSVSDGEADLGEASAALRPGIDPESWRIVAVADVVMELPRANPEIVLHEAQHPWRELRIPVALTEGAAIAYALRGVDTPRPLTHDLFSDVLGRHGVTVEAVRVTLRRGQVFFAELDTMGPKGRRVVPCRPSDGIALALRQRMPVPVLVAEWVFTGGEEPPGLDVPPGP
ncbi:MAG: bifunctional nuclease family protein [Acidimicrobiales bacterium]|jgi:bifunctional DNase/RNase